MKTTKNICRLAKTRKRRTADMGREKSITDKDGTLLTKEEGFRARW